MQKKEYQAPELKELGNVKELTQQTNQGMIADEALESGQSIAGHQMIS